MDIALDATARGWQGRAFKFATEELIPHEVEAELNEGRLAPEIEKRHKKLAVELGFSAMDVPKARGGLGLRIVDQVAAWSSSAASRTRFAGAFRKRRAGCSRPAARTRSSATSCRS